MARLKGNLPQLFADAPARFAPMAPRRTFYSNQDYVEVWDADDFDPWETLSWTTVRVLRYRQHKADGTVYEAYWLTNFPLKKVSSQTLYRLAKSRWEIENQGFNDGKNRYGMEPMTHHQANSLLIQWLLTGLALTLERLYRLRYLRRGTHTPHTAMEFLLLLWLSLGSPPAPDSS